MASIKPSVPKGTRDFSPVEMVKRNYIFDTIKSVFRKYGYQQIETPTMENLSTLTGKYGDEGDKLIFKVLDSGEYFDSKSLESFFNELDKGLFELQDNNDFEVLDSMYDLVSKYNLAETEIDKKAFHDQYEKNYKLIAPKNRLVAFNKLTTQISEKALRYDLTVPFCPLRSDASE
jgi:histidyl-tRNA synthetase